MVSKALHLLELYRELDVPKDKLIFRLPATWQGIQAAKTLEAQGIATQVILAFRCVAKQ